MLLGRGFVLDPFAKLANRFNMFLEICLEEIIRRGDEGLIYEWFDDLRLAEYEKLICD